MVNILMVGAGEYTAGYVPTVHGAANDKPAGVVALTCFDLRRFGAVGAAITAARAVRGPQSRALSPAARRRSTGWCCATGPARGCPP